MRIESHLKKIKRFERTIAKLNLEEAFGKIKDICNKILKGKDERKFKNSN